MNKNLNEMTNDEIKLEIAKMKGYTLEPHRDCSCGNLTWYLKNVICLPSENPPNWPESIAAAWSLVDEMRTAENTEVYINAGYTYFGINVFDNTRHGDEAYNDLGLLAEAHAEIAQLAICRAYLQWAENQRGSNGHHF